MGWEYVDVTLLGISFVASLVVWIWSLRSIRKSNGDPVRKAFREASGATFILTIAIFLSFLKIILGFAGAYLGENGYVHLMNVALLWSNLADATMFAALAYLTMSILRLQNLNSDIGKTLKIRKFAALGYFAVLLIMSVVYFGFTFHVMNTKRDLDNTYNDWSYMETNDIWDRRYDAWVDASATSGRLVLSLVVLILLGNLGLLAEAVRIMVQTHTSRSVTTASHYLLASVIVWLIRSLFRVITVAQYSILDSSLGRPRAEMMLYYGYLLVPLLENWPFIAALGIFIGLGTRSHNGVWSHNADGMMNAAHPEAPKDDRRRQESV